MSTETARRPKRRAVAVALIVATAAVVVGSTVSCGEAAPCTEGTTVCNPASGRGRTCVSGEWVELIDGPCAPEPRVPPTPPTPPPAPSSVDARAPDAADASGEAGAATDARAPDAADAGDCPVDLGAALGAPCPREGQFCGSCGNPCQFCNFVRCELGKWRRIEVPPAPCDAGDGG